MNRYFPILGKLIFPSLLTFIILISYSFFTLSENTTENRFDLDNIPMCAPVSNPLFSSNIPLDGPLAPELKPNWKHSFSITTASNKAQEFFDQGMFYMYGFNHAEAERSFKEAIRLDPKCAMAYWGAGLTIGPNINRSMQKDKYEEAYNFSQKALELINNCSPKEQALIKALSKRYIKNPPRNRSKLDAIYADEMRIVAHRFREDVDVLTLFAEALMDTMPWDYWETDGSPRAATREMHATLDYVLEQMPEHPGANHYYIHSVEAIQPEIAERCADKLKEVEYKSGHLVHMPSHIYVRLGRYHDANTSNLEAIKLDETYIASCEEQGYYAGSYYPHNIHFLWFGATMTGQSQLAMETAEKTAEKDGRGRYTNVPLYGMLRFGKWEEILQYETPNDKDVFHKTIWHYAQGMAHIKMGQLKQAKKSLAILKKRKKARAISKLPSHKKGMTEICYLVLAGEIAASGGDYNQQVALLKEAVKIQDGFMYMEPPFFYVQLRQNLGAAQLEAGMAKAAEKSFRDELAKFPNNGWSLFGLHQSLKAQGNTEAAAAIKQQFEKAWAKADVELTSAVF